MSDADDDFLLPRLPRVTVLEDLGDRLVEHQDALVADMQAGGVAATWIMMGWKFWFENPENKLARIILADLFEKWLVLDAMKHREVG